MKKKIISMALAIVMCMSLCISASAAEGMTLDENAREIETAKSFAYLNVEDASPEMREKILAAREQIINSTDWVADGYECAVYDVTNDTVVEYLPHFSEVFPDWDVPVVAASLAENESTYLLEEGIAENDGFPYLLNEEVLDIGVGPDDWIGLATFRTYLEKASQTVNADPFATFTVDPYEMGTTIRTYANTLTSSETYNLGITNAKTGESLVLKTRLSEGQGVALYGLFNNERLSIRASTYSTPGWATMEIDGCNRVIDVR